MPLLDQGSNEDRIRPDQATSGRQSESALPKLLAITTVLLIIVAAYVGWTMYSRHQASKEAADAIQAKKDQQEKQVVDTVYGAGEVRFTQFYADPITIHRGEKSNLCFGVVNAKSLSIDPPIEQLHPSYTHCTQVSPAKETTYTLTAEDAKGGKHTATLTIHVR